MSNEQQPPAYTQYGRSSYQPLAPAPRPPRQSRIGWIIVGVFSVCVIACCIGALVLVSPSNFRMFSNINTGPPQQFSTPATPNGPQPIFAPVLGGTVSDFTQQYGPPANPADTTGGLWSQLIIAGQQVMLTVSAAPLKYSQDGQPHIYVLSVQAPKGVTWRSSTQQRLMAVFLPSDATFQRQQSTSNGYERIYRSAQLAATFTPDLFTNDAGTQTVAPGTLYEGCNLGTAPVRAGGLANSCTISVGVFS
jgi:hypothetical protein